MWLLGMDLVLLGILNIFIAVNQDENNSLFLTHNPLFLSSTGDNRIRYLNTIVKFLSTTKFDGKQVARDINE